MNRLIQVGEIILSATWMCSHMKHFFQPWCTQNHQQNLLPFKCNMPFHFLFSWGYISPQLAHQANIDYEILGMSLILNRFKQSFRSAQLCSLPGKASLHLTDLKCKKGRMNCQVKTVVTLPVSYIDFFAIIGMVSGRNYSDILKIHSFISFSPMWFQLQSSFLKNSFPKQLSFWTDHGTAPQINNSQSRSDAWGESQKCCISSSEIERL